MNLALIRIACTVVAAASLAVAIWLHISRAEFAADIAGQIVFAALLAAVLVPEPGQRGGSASSVGETLERE